MTLSSDVVTIEKKLSWFFDLKHLVLAGSLVAALLTGVYFFESKRVDVAQAKAEIASQIAEVTKQAAVSSALQNAAQQEEAKQVEAEMAAVTAQLTVANQQLQAANRQLTDALTSQRKIDIQLTPQDQASHWEKLIPTAKVQAITSGFAVDSVGGLDTIQALEEIPIDRSKIANLETEVKNDEKTIVDDAVSLSAEKTAHNSDVNNDKRQLMAAKKETDKVQNDFNAYKKKTGRNFFRIFFAGVVVGIIGGYAAGI